MTTYDELLAARRKLDEQLIELRRARALHPILFLASILLTLLVAWCATKWCP